MSTVIVSAEGSGYKSAFSGSQTTISVLKSAIGGLSVDIQVASEGGGLKVGIGDAYGLLVVTGEGGTGLKNAIGGTVIKVHVLAKGFLNALVSIWRHRQAR